MLLNSRLGQPGDTDAVTAHPQGFFRASLIGETGLQGL